MDGRGFLVQMNEALRARSAQSYVCECGASGCVALVDLPLAVYDGIRAVDGTVLADGHPPAARRDNGAAPQPRDHELPALRESLRGRVADVWERLNDAVSELQDVHDVSREEIVGRVGDALDSTD